MQKLQLQALCARLPPLAALVGLWAGPAVNGGCLLLALVLGGWAMGLPDQPLRLPAATQMQSACYGMVCVLNFLLARIHAIL